jgi:regulator of replication initiation timing
MKTQFEIALEDFRGSDCPMCELLDQVDTLTDDLSDVKEDLKETQEENELLIQENSEHLETIARIKLMLGGDVLKIAQERKPT